MITMEGREDAANETVENLKAAGIETEVFVQPFDWEVGPPSNNRNSRRALAWAMGNVKGKGILFVEDDIIIKPSRMKRALLACEELDELCYLYMHDIPPRTDFYPSEPWIRAMSNAFQYHPSRAPEMLADFHPEEGIRQLAANNLMYGSQCVYIPRPYIRFLFNHLDQSYTYSSRVKSSPQEAFDTALNSWRASNGIPAYCYLPHPVQHLQNRTRRQGSRIDTYSRSFDFVSKEDLDEQLSDHGEQ